MALYIFSSALLILLYMTGLFVIALARKDNSLADIGWGIGFILVALLTFVLEPGFALRHLLIVSLVLIWGLRLAVHVFIRNRGRGEDFRYARWRKDWGKSFVIRSYFQVFILQGMFMFLISAPLLIVNHSNEQGLIVLDVIGIVFWSLGFVFEAVGDGQLVKFKRDPSHKGKIITSGLWSTTRHPNYFGEATQWWGIFLIALSVRNGWLAVISPVVITFLLLRVSGVTMLEKKYAGNPEFAAYARRTSAFVPRKPKKTAS